MSGRRPRRARGAAPPPTAAPEAPAAAPARRLARWRAAAARAWAERGAPPLLAAPAASGWLAAAFGALALAAAATALAGERLARDWGAEYGRAATLMQTGPAEGREARFAAAVEALELMPGVTAVRPLPEAERAALLAPWLGPDAEGAGPAPPMAEVLLAEGARPDPTLVAARLEAQAPGALYDDHGAWRDPLLGAARELRAAGWAAAAAVAAAGMACVFAAARAAVRGVAAEIDLLRRLGADDAQLLGAAGRAAAARAAVWGAVGAATAAAALAATPPVAGVALALSGWGWAAVAAVPALLGAAAAAGARLGARRAAVEGRA